MIDDGTFYFLPYNIKFRILKSNLFRVGFSHVALFGGIPGESFVTKLTFGFDISSLVFLLLVPFEDGLGGEVLAALWLWADLPVAEVLGLDVDLHVLTGAELVPTDLADQLRPRPGVFAPHVNLEVPLALSEVVAVSLGAGEGQVAVGQVFVSLEVHLPAVGLPTVRLVTGELLPGVDLEVSQQADLLGGLVVTVLTIEPSFPSAFFLFLLREGHKVRKKKLYVKIHTSGGGV